MKRQILLLSAMAACAFTQVQAQTTEPSKNVLMRDGTFIASHETFGKYYANGAWHDNSVENLNELLDPAVSTPEEDMAALFAANWVSDLNGLAVAWGYGTGDVAGFVQGSGYGTLEEFVQAMGPYNNLEELSLAWTGQVMSPEDFARYMGYVDPNSINWDEIANSMYYGNIQEYATANYGTVTHPIFDSTSVGEIAGRLGELSPATYQELLANPSINEEEGYLITLQKGLAAAINDGTLTEWSPQQTQQALLDYLQAFAFQVPNPEVLSQLDFSDFDPTGLEVNFVQFQGSNITGEQLNKLGVTAGVSFEGMDITGFDLSNRYFGSHNFKGVTGLVPSQLNSAQVSQSNFSDLDLTGWNASGKDINGVNFENSIVEMALLNGSTSLINASLKGVNLTGFNANGKGLSGVNFQNTTGLSVANLGTAQNLHGADFRGATTVGGTPITRAALTAAILATGRSLTDPHPGGWGGHTLGDMLDYIQFD